MKKLSLFVYVFLILITGKVEAAVQTLYAAQNGSGSTCSAASPCTLATALSTVAGGDGDTIILYGPNEGHGTGVYSAISLSGTSHQDLTITSTQSVKDALTFTKGVPAGTDNRPRILGTGGTQLSIAASGATVSYLRIRGASSPDASNSWWNVTTISAPSTIDHCEIYNGGQGVRITHRRSVTISNNYIHDTGNPSGPLGDDNHAIEICSSSGTESTSWGTAVVIDNNTVTKSGGDFLQENTSTYCSGEFSYLIVSNNHAYGHKEQAIDQKGTRYMKVYGNDFHDNAFGGIAAQNEGSAMTNWYIYNNIIHDHTNYGIACLGGNGNNWWIWNNIFFHNAYSQDYKSYGAILAAPQNTKIAHNVFWNNPGGGIVHEGSASGVTVQNNIFYNNGEEGGVETGPAISYNWFNTSDPGARGSNAVTGSNPYFVNVSTPPYDFHINAANSNADGAGANLAGTSDYTIDLDARNDLRGSAPWLGVYEGEGQTTRPSAPQGLVIIIK